MYYNVLKSKSCSVTTFIILNSYLVLCFYLNFPSKHTYKNQVLYFLDLIINNFSLHINTQTDNVNSPASRSNWNFYFTKQKWFIN